MESTNIPNNGIIIIEEIDKLFQQGQYDIALDKINQFHQNSMQTIPQTQIIQIELSIWKSRIFDQKGSFQQALSLARESLRISQEINSLTLEFKSFVAIAYPLWHLGRLDKALEMCKAGELKIEKISFNAREPLKEEESTLYNVFGIIYHQQGELDRADNYFQKSLVMRVEVGNQQNISATLNNIGLIYWDKGKLDTALEYLQKSLTIVEELNNQHDISMSLSNISLIYWKKGKFNTALEYSEQSLTLKQKLGNNHQIAMSLNIHGLIYQRKGELDIALEYYQKCLTLNKEDGNSHYIANALSNMGVVYKQKGELDTALDYLQKSLSLREKVENAIYTSETLFFLIQLAIILPDDTLVQQYLSKLETLNQKQNNNNIALRYRLAPALVLKSHTRLKKIIQAQNILEEIVAEKIIDHDLTIIALQALCEILLLELKSTENVDVLKEANTHVNRLYELAQSQQLVPFMIEALILKAKFAILDGNIQKGNSLLLQATMSAEEKNLFPLKDKITREENRIKSNLKKWKSALDNKTFIGERNEKIWIDEYLVIIKELELNLQQLKLSEQEIRIKNQALEQSYQELNEFAAILSHDLSGSVTLISGYAQWLQRENEGQLDKKSRKYLNIITNQTHIMGKMINDILTYSKATQNQGNSPDAKVLAFPINTKALIDEVIQTLAPSSEIVIQVVDPIPTVFFPKIQFFQIFQNLLQNALKFLDKPEKIIRIACESLKGVWQFSISDTGRGIEKKDFKRIFQLFQQSKSTIDQKGTGLGLTIVKKIVEMHKGIIWVESELDKGSSFFFTILKSQ